jgi:hypothetical protein
MTERIKLTKNDIVIQGNEEENDYWIYNKKYRTLYEVKQLKSQILSDYEKAEKWDKLQKTCYHCGHLVRGCQVCDDTRVVCSVCLEIVERLKKRIEELEQYTFHGSYLSDGSQTKSFHSGITFEELQKILGEEK